VWSIETLDETVDDELTALPVDMRARFQRICEGKLWEMRMAGRNGIARAIYVTAKGRRGIVLRAFMRKTEETPRSELRLAAERARRLG
jgi:phage-related protein